MVIPKDPLAQYVLLACKHYGITNIVISPGSRNAPLILGFSEDTFFKTHSIVDERCAGFFALGLSLNSKSPSALVCTSGSALLNYYPAIAEAYYNEVPMVVISADRPPQMIDIGDGQTIRQQGVFANHILYEANLIPLEDFENTIKIQKAITAAITHKGPVHINIPFEEPLYQTTSSYTVAPSLEPLKNIGLEKAISESDLELFSTRWNSSKKKLILIGQTLPNTIHTDTLKELAKDPSVVILKETISNVHHDEFLGNIDSLLMCLGKSPEALDSFAPDLLLTFGGMVISKRAKEFLRKHKPRYHFHIDPKRAYDTFFCLTHHFKTDLNGFFDALKKRLNAQNDSEYKSRWHHVDKQLHIRHTDYISTCDFSDLSVFSRLFRAIPHHSNLHLGNSSTVRYMQFFDLDASIHVFCNRGTSGIEGCTSTAIGASIYNEMPTTLLVGDLGFFYDSNALWNGYTRADFRIIIVNNGGGGIFRTLPHENSSSKIFETFFETKHSLTSKHLAEMFNFDYISANSNESLESALPLFYRGSPRPKILEAFTSSEFSSRVLSEYLKQLM